MRVRACVCVCVCVCACIVACVCSCVRVCACDEFVSILKTRMDARTCPPRANTHAHTHTYIYTNTHTRARTRTCARARTRARTRTHTRARARTHTHTHTQRAVAAVTPPSLYPNTPTIVAWGDGGQGGEEDSFMSATGGGAVRDYKNASECEYEWVYPQVYTHGIITSSSSHHHNPPCFSAPLACSPVDTSPE